MKKAIVSAIFDDRKSAERAVAELRRSGVPDDSISVVGRHSEGDRRGEEHEHEHEHEHDVNPDNKGSGAIKGLGVGAGVGALFGLGALVIPGVGPFIAAGSLIGSLGIVGSAAASGAIVGGTAGGLAGALMKYGLSDEDAEYFEKRIKEGGIWVAVDTRRTIQDPDTVAGILHSAGGKSTSRVRNSEREVARA